MMRNQLTNFRNLAAHFFLGSLALALVTLVFFRLGADLASTAFAYLIVIVLLSLMGSFIASATDLVGQSVPNVFFEEDRAFVRKYVGVCLEIFGKSHVWEIQKVRKDGSVLWVRENAKAERQANNQLIVLIACGDITERKQIGDALRQSEAYLAEAQRLRLTGSFGWRMVTGKIIWSAETLRIFGYDEAPPVTIDMVVERTHPEDRAGGRPSASGNVGPGARFRFVLPLYQEETP
jgi:PAS domain-containing protein